MTKKTETIIQQEIRNIVESFGDLYVIDKQLKKDMIISSLDNYDEKLIKKLFSNKLIKDTFTQTIGDNKILKINEIVKILETDEYWTNSYTKYRNKIGLTCHNHHLDEVSDVVLDFPYKDSILKGGMSSEDVSKKDMHESFLNEVVAREEIDVLLDSKIFSNIKKYDSEGVHPISSIDMNDNLIIKGNNLLALHSLEKKYSGKIKLIFIDPPYNTGKDSFLYNDKFNHSSWLTFIKNRLEIAWKLLSDDGTIWISVDDTESHYLKVLADNIFGRSNFMNEVIWQRAYAPINLKKTFSRSHDSILVYAKNNSTEKTLNKIPRKASMIANYKNPDNDPRGVYKADNFSVGPAVEKNIYEITTPSGRKVLPPDGYSWRFSKERYKELLLDNRVYFGKDGNSAPSYKRFLSEVKEGVVPQTLWTYQEVGHNQDAKKEIKALFEGRAAFETPKPEKLLQRIIQIGSDDGDFVLDFFMGSSTTQSVAHKMNRKYIGIEQLDYIETVSVERLKKVIHGEQGGISKDVNWHGGGSFIYAELMNKNSTYINEVLESKNTKELKQVFDKFKRSVDFDFRVDLMEVSESIWNEEFELQKKILVQIIDKNQLYHNYFEIDDENISKLLTPEEYKFNKCFYGDYDGE
ncbi:type III restriction endonuclease subunit M [Streptococcus parauberis]|nr:type III restriction endonuclease subunit M [Streptococcus parauberis]